MSAKLTLDDRVQLGNIALINREQSEALADLLDGETLSAYAVKEISEALHRCLLIQSFLQHLYSHDPS